jgi:hypothetical protein
MRDIKLKEVLKEKLYEEVDKFLDTMQRDMKITIADDFDKDLDTIIAYYDNNIEHYMLSVLISNMEYRKGEINYSEK